MMAWVLVGGRLVAHPEIARVRQLMPPALVVAADGGIAHAAMLGVRPDLWVGDFDSSDPHAPQWAGIERREFPCDKDELDSELALRLAFERGARRFVVWGAFGGRFDHTLALAALAIEWTARGTPVLLHSGDESAVPLLGGTPLDLAVEVGQTLSLLALNTFEDVHLDGVRWPLRGARITPGTVRTMSNLATANRVHLRAAEGAGLVVLQHRIQ